MKRNISLIFCICVLFILGLFLTAAEAGGPKNPDLVINLDVSPKAKITNIIVYKGKWANQPAIWIQAKVQNVATEPLQLKTRCSSDSADITRGFWIPKVEQGIRAIIFCTVIMHVDQRLPFTGQV